MRRPFVAGNWKMNKTADQAVALVETLKPLLADLTADREVVICPPFTSLHAVKVALAGSRIGLGAQNMHWESSGAYTGELSAEMILTSGCTHVILGHSERRQYFGETDATVNRKLVAALKAGLAPIVCVGETLQQREADQIEAVVLGQVDAGLQGLTVQDVVRITLAYEPVWAIGTGRTASAAQAEEVHALIRGRLRQLFGDQVAAQVRIQYGGSVKADNAADLFAQENIDGGLIGGAALDAVSFAAIVKAAG
ncbi:MAG: triose-phosphate isomerase [Candidatus Latescibacterota bacterium]|jgi:triosephosphate isomerase